MNTAGVEMNYIKEDKNPEPICDNEHMVIYRGGGREFIQEKVIAEHSIDIYINNKITMKLVCTPENLEELILGRFITEEIITGLNDIENISILDNEKKAEVVLRDNFSDKNFEYAEVKTTGDSERRVLSGKPLRMRESKAVNWKAEWIFNLADEFGKGMPLHNQTRAAHSCFLAAEGRLLFKCEDIGRHNALDKIIGYGLKNGINPESCMVYTSGRVPVDMVVKAVRAGIPIMVSKAEPTIQAVRLAEEYGLTLICAARSDRFKVYASGGSSDKEDAAVIGGNSSE